MLITEEPQLIRVVPTIISQVTLLLFADAGLENNVNIFVDVARKC